MRAVILGSGTSFGVPVIGCDCPVCTSTDPRDRRTRTAALVEADDGRRILIDTPPELRLQLLRAGVDRVDAVLYTHEHADHVHGVDDLRAISDRVGALPVYGSPQTLGCLRERFGYIFDGVGAAEGTTKPQLLPQPLEAYAEVEVAGLSVLPLPFDHGGIEVLGFRVGSFAYCTDVKTVTDEARARLHGVRVLIVNALFDRPHPTHLSIDEAVGLARSVGAERTYLTHLTHRFRHAELSARLPDGVEPAHDGLVVPF